MNGGRTPPAHAVTDTVTSGPAVPSVILSKARTDHSEIILMAVFSLQVGTTQAAGSPDAATPHPVLWLL